MVDAAERVFQWMTRLDDHGFDMLPGTVVRRVVDARIVTHRMSAPAYCHHRNQYQAKSTHGFSPVALYQNH
jgi:hypothetical protein